MRKLLPDAGSGSPGNIAIVVLFVALLLAPAVLAVTGHAGFDAAFIERTELREPFVAPAATSGALATGGWERDAERTIADAFPLRSGLIGAYHGVQYRVLHDLSAPLVIVGRDGWLFYAVDERRYLTGDYDARETTLARTADAYAGRARWCDARGIAYLLVLAPNKSTVYAAFLPPRMHVAAPTLADRLVPLFRARGVRVVDERAAMRADAVAAGADPLRMLYSKGDTHWTDIAAYVEYRAVVDALRTSGVRDRIDPRALQPYVTETGESDLFRLAGISPFVRDRVVRYYFPRRARDAAASPAVPVPTAISPRVRALTTGDAGLPNAVIFGDSFSSALTPFLAEDFDRTVVANYAPAFPAVRFDRHLVAAARPRIVIQEIVERSLVDGPGLDD